MIIFDGSDIRVVAQPADGAPLWVVTFTGRDHNPPVASGAGEKFLGEAGVNAVHFISKANHWWRTDEFVPAIAATRDYLNVHRAETVVTYGSSMGAHGALIGAGPLGARRTVASMPQYSVDPALTPWETRWRKDVRRMQFQPGEPKPQIGALEVIIFYDPYFELDRRHVELVSEHGDVRLMKVAFAEHAVSPALLECDLLKSVTLDAIRGDLTPADFHRRYRAARRKSPIVVWGASAVARARGRRPLAEGLRNAALDAMLTPGRRIRADNRRIILESLNGLLADKRLADCLVLLDRWREQAEPQAAEMLIRAWALTGLGRTGEALEQALAAQQADPRDKTTNDLVGRLQSDLSARAVEPQTDRQTPRARGRRVTINVDIDPYYMDRVAALVTAAPSLASLGFDLVFGSEGPADLLLIQDKREAERRTQLGPWAGPMIVYERIDAGVVSASKKRRRLLCNPQVTHWLKEVTLRDPRLHNAPLLESRLHLAMLEPDSPEVTKPSIHLSDEILTKVRAVLPMYTQDRYAPFREAPLMPWRDRRNPILCCGAIHSKVPALNRHRRAALGIIQRHCSEYVTASGSVIPQPIYGDLVRNTRIFISPYGLGEYSFKDFEAIMSGCLLIKPDSRHVTSYGFDIYGADDRFCEFTRPDMSDLPEILDRLAADPTTAHSKAMGAAQALRAPFDFEAYARDLAAIFVESLESFESNI